MPRKHPKAAPGEPSASSGSSDVSTVAFVSLGCPKNLVDSEKMLGLLAEDGLTPVAFDVAEQGGADAVVVNTCGFLEASKDESLGVIKEAIALKEQGRVKRVVVAGCLVQRHRATMLDWAPGIDAMIGVFDRDRIVDAVRGPKHAGPGQRRARQEGASDDKDQPRYWIASNALIAAQDRGMATTGLTVNGKDGKGVGYFEDDRTRLRLTPRHYAYLRVSEGCNQNCAFCTIPSIRGKMRSKPLETILAEAKELIADGVFEMHLIGQDTTSYGDDIGQGLAQAHGGLPAMLATVSRAYDEMGVKDGWIRLMYAYPSNFSDACIDAIAKTPRVLPYIDIPLQHASDRMLAAMRRNTTAAHTRELLGKLRSRIKNMTIRTTFISGFPGETEADHQELLAFIAEQKFEAVGVFEYSKEPGTTAGTMEEDPALAVPPEVKARRRGEIMALQQKLAFERQAAIAAEFNEHKPAATGRRIEVLIDTPLRSQGRATSGVGKGGQLYQGRTFAQAPQIDSLTYVQSKKKLVPGDLVHCTIVGADGYDLVAKPVEELEKRVGLSVLSK